MAEMTLPAKNRYGFYGDFEISGDGSMEWQLELCTMTDCGHTHASPVVIRVWEADGKWFLRNDTKDSIEGERRKVHEFPTRDAALMYFGYVIHTACEHVRQEVGRANLMIGAMGLLNKWGFSL